MIKIKKGKIVNIVNNLYIYIPFRADGFFHFIIIIHKSHIYTSQYTLLYIYTRHIYLLVHYIYIRYWTKNCHIQIYTILPLPLGSCVCFNYWPLNFSWLLGIKPINDTQYYYYQINIKQNFLLKFLQDFQMRVFHRWIYFLELSSLC